MLEIIWREDVLSRISLRHLIIWAMFAVSSAITSIGIFVSFRFLLLEGWALIQRIGIPLYVIPFAGAFVCGLVIYKIDEESAGEGIPRYLVSVNTKNGYFPFLPSTLKYFAALVTLVTGNSGGIVGPLVRVNAGFMSFLTNLFLKVGLTEKDRRTSAICGVAGIFAVIFHTPIAGGLFAVEVLKRAKMGYLDLFPSILSSCFVVALCKRWDIAPFYSIYTKNDFLSHEALIWIPLIGLVTGYGGLFYSKFYSWIRHVMGRDQLKLRYMLLSALVISGVAFAGGESLMGTSLILFAKISKGELINIFTSQMYGGAAITLLVLAVLKAITNCITVGSGLSAGFTGPAFLIGLLLAASLADLVGIEIDSVTYYGFLAAGMSGFLSSSMNVPLAAAVMGAEVFGSQYSFPAATSAIIAFQIARGETMYVHQFDDLDK